MNYKVTTNGHTSTVIGLESLLTAITDIATPYTIEEVTDALEALHEDTQQMNPVMEALDTLTEAYTTGDQDTIDQALEWHQEAARDYLDCANMAARAIRNTDVWT